MNVLDSNRQMMMVDAVSHACAMMQSDFAYYASRWTLPHVLYRPTLTHDGNQWCALLGEDIQSGICGFGDSPADAMAEFDKEWDKKLPKEQP